MAKTGTRHHMQVHVVCLRFIQCFEPHGKQTGRRKSVLVLIDIIVLLCDVLVSISLDYVTKADGQRAGIRIFLSTTL